MTQLANVNLNITSWEMIVFLFLFAGGFLLGLMIGKDKLFLMLLGGYVSSAIISIVPIKKLLPDFFKAEENFVVMIVLFLLLIGIVYLLFSKSILKARRKANRAIFQAFFYGIFLVGIVVSMIFSFLPADLISKFSSLPLEVFNTTLARIIWFIVPLIFIGIFRSKK
ncbi:MAG: hypothetical protein V1686_02250 [Patescibacteria group bacterium]